MSYGLYLNNSHATRLSYDQTQGTAPGTLDSLNSYKFSFNQLTNRAGAFINFKNEKILVNLGTKLAGIEFKQDDPFRGNVYRRHFLNLLPQLNFQDNFTRYRFLSFNYSGKTVLPGLEQLQPVQMNDDPLFIVRGNPALDLALSIILR